MNYVQEFVNALNFKTMPKMGFVRYEGQWWWLKYDVHAYDQDDFEVKDHTKAQMKRLKVACLESPDGLTTIRVPAKDIE